MFALFLNTNRNGYSPAQCGSTMTVGELKELLDDYNDDTAIFFKNDEGYTYGSLDVSDIEDDYYDEDE